jgi:hypothetical protein
MKGRVCVCVCGVQADGYGLSEGMANALTHLISEDWQVYIANQQLGLWDQFKLGVRHFEVRACGVCRVVCRVRVVCCVCRVVCHCARTHSRVQLDVHWWSDAIRICHAGGIHLQSLNDFIKFLGTEFGIHIDWDSETIGCFSPVSTHLRSTFPQALRISHGTRTRTRTWHMAHAHAHGTWHTHTHTHTHTCQYDRTLNDTFVEIRQFVFAPGNEREFVIFYFDDEEDLLSPFPPLLCACRAVCVCGCACAVVRVRLCVCVGEWR